MKIVVIGNISKPLTFNVVNGIMVNEKYSLELVVLKKTKPKPKIKKNIFSRGYNYVKKNGIKGLMSKLYSRIVKSTKSDATINVKELCVTNNISYWEDLDLNSLEVFRAISSVQPDVIVLAGSSVIKEHIFSQAKLYTINIHRSLLPKYAGLQAIFWALYYDEPEVGATVHTVNKGIDTGDIITQRKRVVGKDDDIETLTDWYFQIAPDLIIEALDIVSSPNVSFTKQDKSQRSYFSRPTEEQEKELYIKLKNRR